HVWQNPERSTGKDLTRVAQQLTASGGLDHLGLRPRRRRLLRTRRKQGGVRKLAAATKGARSSRRGPTRGGPSAPLRNGGGRYARTAVVSTHSGNVAFAIQGAASAASSWDGLPEGVLGGGQCDAPPF